MSLGYRKIKEKWALMMSDFAEEAGDQKLQTLRKLGFRGLGVEEPRLKQEAAGGSEGGVRVGTEGLRVVPAAGV
jgi:hypothetical protein